MAQVGQSCQSVIRGLPDKWLTQVQGEHRVGIEAREALQGKSGSGGKPTVQEVSSQENSRTWPVH